LTNWSVPRSLARRLFRRPARGVSSQREAPANCRHVAIIMDGNGRWARRRGLPVAAGHRAGAKALHAAVECAPDLGITELTAFCFSTENWRRSPEEVEALFDLFVEMVRREIPQLQKQGVRVRFLGRRTGLRPDLVAQMEESEARTAGNERMTLYLAFNYGGQAELADAAVALAKAYRQGDLATTELPAEPPEDILRPFLYAPDMHDPELLIRTSGELRLSNFLLWQLAYTELVFSPKLWPDFGPRDLAAALDEYAQRRRRYGGR